MLRLEDNLRKKKILIIDDEDAFLRLFEWTFQRLGARVFTALSGKEGMRHLNEHQPDLVILDVMMPEQDGWETCLQIRQFSNVPVMFLTVLSRNEDMIRGFSLGADDFVTKPVGFGELQSRARAILRRSPKDHYRPTPVCYEDGELCIDLINQEVNVRGELIRLSPKEYRVLEYLLQNEGEVCTFQQILRHVWGEEYQGCSSYIHVHVARLRKKLEKVPGQPKYIRTVHRKGYQFITQAMVV